MEESLIIGRNPVIEALKNGLAIDRIMVLQGTHGPFEIELRKLSKAANIPLQVAPKEAFNRVSKGNHQGAIAYITPIAFQSLGDILDELRAKGETALFVLLDGITDVRNIGAIARSAECFGAHAIVVSAKHMARLNEDAVKASAGALTRMPVCRMSSTAQALDLLGAEGVHVFAAALQGAEALDKIDLTGHAAILMGSEDKGLPRELLQRADVIFKIPQTDRLDSLNVSVASGVVLYEVYRQRQLSK
ncbi:MAG: 23S rRNA (guanosine(2251)-2'-O)-methyltransferase RlmB [Saprospiraceae bacterium]